MNPRISEEMAGVLAALAQPFPVERVSWRVGSVTRDRTRGMALAYLDARDVMDRLDAYVGPGNWECRYHVVGEKTWCELSLLVDGRWVTKSDGAGDTDFEGNKGAFSTAFKRAAVRWGIGRYLYDIDNKWVELESNGRDIAETEIANLNRNLRKCGESYRPAVAHYLAKQEVDPAAPPVMASFAPAPEPAKTPEPAKAPEPAKTPEPKATEKPKAPPPTRPTHPKAGTFFETVSEALGAKINEGDERGTVRYLRAMLDRASEGKLTPEEYLELHGRGVASLEIADSVHATLKALDEVINDLSKTKLPVKAITDAMDKATRRLETLTAEGRN